VIGVFRQGAALVCDGVPLADLAASHGTPLFVYSAAVIAARYRAIDAAFDPHPHVIHYALKANSILAIVRLLRSLGSGVDANSGGEIDVALRAGFIPPQIIFTGVGKTTDELAEAIELGVRTINAESWGEIERIDLLSRERQTRTRIAIRVNPDIDARSHPHISTGLRTSKFGVPLGSVREVCRRARGLAGVEVIGLHSHVGSQITDLEPLRHAADALVHLSAELRDDGIAIEHLDLGGGLGVSYDGSPVPGAQQYAEALLPVVRDSRLSVILEPGRHIVAPAGVLIAQVIDVKEQDGNKLFIVLDAGMTELIRPMLYNAFHRIEPVVRTSAGEVMCDVVGPLCESSDTLGKDRKMPRPDVGDLFAVLDVGAYGSAMASNYNRRLMPAEVLIANGTPTVIKRRQTIDELLALED
jgi:diaminopimelate decarboxylase